VKALILLLVCACLAACRSGAAPERVIEVMHAGPIAFQMRAQGQLRATKATPLQVPGTRWARRRLVWMIADGSQVKSGQVVAKFLALDSSLDLEKALLELQRNTLARATKKNDLDIGVGRIAVDLAQTDAQLGIAQRFAQAEMEALARNVILDAIEDRTFLGEKRAVLGWRQSQSRQRGAAELQVLAAQRATFEGKASRQRDDLAALTLVAPHDGVLVLESDWSGTKPQLGADLWAGNALASLPDSSALEVELQVPQAEAQGLVEAGQPVRMWPLGRPDQAVDSVLSWVASAAQVRNRESPVKYLAMKAPVTQAMAHAYGWVPGQAFEAEIVLARADKAFSVSNLSLDGDNGTASVNLLEGTTIVRRDVVLGRRGVARTEVSSGINEGDRVIVAMPPLDGSP